MHLIYHGPPTLQALQADTQPETGLIDAWVWYRNTGETETLQSATLADLQDLLSYTMEPSEHVVLRIITADPTT